MRIAMVGSRGIPARSGGVERVVQELTAELSARGHEVIVYGRRRYLAGAPPPGTGKVILTRGLGGKHLDTITHTATAMLDVIRRGVDVVHIHSPGPALLSWIPRMASLPIVLTIHAPDWRRDKWRGPARLALRLGLACGMKRADVVTAVSRSLAAELTERFGREVLHVPNAVGPVKFAPAGRLAAWGLKADGYVLYVGRIVPEKRLDLLIRVWAQVRTDCKLVVAGPFDDMRYARLCQSLAGADVMFLGPQYDDALAELYAGAAMVVLPGVLEGMSLVLLEAAAHGRCTLAADIPENAEVMGDSILYFTKDDGAELAAQICRSLENEAMRGQLAAKARQRVIRKYSWSEVASRMEVLYNKVVQRRSK